MVANIPAQQGRLASMFSNYSASLSTFLFCFLSLLFSYLTYNSLNDSLSARQQLNQGDRLLQRFEQLSLMAKNYVLTGELNYQLSYNALLDIDDSEKFQLSDAFINYWQLLTFENSITLTPDETAQQLIQDLQLPENELALLEQAKNAMTQLTLIEFKAFSEIQNSVLESVIYPQSKASLRAKALLESDAYRLQVTQATDTIEQLFELQKARVINQLQSSESYHSLMVVFTLLCYLCLMLSLAYSLYQQFNKKTNVVKNLTSKVSNRTLALFEKREELKVVIHEMDQTKKQLVESEKMASLGSLVSGVAHEVNTPLGIGVTLGTHLQDETQSLVEKITNETLKRSDLERYCSETIENCSLLQSNLERAATLIRSFKQVAVDRSSDELRTFQMSEYIDEVILSLGAHLKQTAIQIEKTIPENEPLLTTYPGAIAQIITNIVMNALTHGFDGGKGAGKISFVLTTENHDMLLSINDNGKGMSAEVLGKIFEPFFTTQRGNGGSGLGLHIVYNLIVQRLGGSIKCTSIMDEGTTFLLRFPKEVKH